MHALASLLASVLLTASPGPPASPPVVEMGQTQHFRTPLGAQALAFSPDGRLLAAAGGATRAGVADPLVWLFDVRTGRKVASLKGAPERAAGLAFSHDGSALFVASRFGEVARVDLSRRKVTASGKVAKSGPIQSAAASPDGEWVALGAAKHVILLDPGLDEAGRASGELLGFDDSGRLWVVVEGEAKMVDRQGYPVGAGCRLPPGVSRWRWDDGVALGVGRRGVTRVDVVRCRRASGPAVRADVAARAMAFGAGGRLVATGGDRVEVLDGATGRPLHRSSGQKAGAADVAIAPDGRLVATLSEDGDVVIWERSSGRVAAHAKVAKPSEALAFADGGRVLVVAGGREVVQLDARSGRRLSSYEPLGLKIERMAVSGSRVAVASNEREPTVVGVFDLRAPRRTLKLRTMMEDTKGWLFQLAFSADGRSVAVGQGTSHQVFVLDAATLEVREQFSLKGRGGAGVLTFSPDGQRLLAHAVFSKKATWLDVTTGKRRLALREKNHAADAAFLASERAAVGYESSGRVRIWDVGARKAVVGFEAHAGGVKRVAATPDGHWLATVGADHVLRVWDLSAYRSVQ